MRIFNTIKYNRFQNYKTDECLLKFILLRSISSLNIFDKVFATLFIIEEIKVEFFEEYIYIYIIIFKGDTQERKEEALTSKQKSDIFKKKYGSLSTIIKYN